MANSYTLICKYPDIVSKLGFRIIGSWLVNASTSVHEIHFDVSNKAAFKIQECVLLSNGKVVRTDEIGEIDLPKISLMENISLLDILHNPTAIMRDDDRFSLASKITIVELMSEMSPSKHKESTHTEESNSEQDTNAIAPQYAFKTKNDYRQLIVDCLAFVDPLCQLPDLLKTLGQTLDLYLCRSLKSSGWIYHFLVDWDVYTVAIPTIGGDSSSLHHELNIPVKVPVFSKCMNIFFKVPDNLLRSVHRHIANLTNEVDRSYAIIEGPYLYYHYMVDKDLNDKGWSCAYRSLQTICSWLLLNGYTDKPVPSIAKIQQILVMIGDKAITFMNTPKWIGTLEASYVLEHYLKISSRIIHLPNIMALHDNALVLYSHFRNTKCPVMIGGGTLAHTILGVSFTESEDETENYKYLVLDPHYAKENDMRNIIDSGYCGWKDINFWKESAFYNLCLPLPSIV